MRRRPLEVKKFEDSRRLGKLIQQSCRKDPGHIISHQEIATRSNGPSDRVRCAYISFNAKQGKLAGFRIPTKKEPLGAPGGGSGLDGHRLLSAVPHLVPGCFLKGLLHRLPASAVGLLVLPQEAAGFPLIPRRVDCRLRVFLRKPCRSWRCQDPRSSLSRYGYSASCLS